MKTKIKKNDLVVVNPESNDCRNNRVMLYRSITANELIRWHMNPINRELDSAGEPKLPPKSIAVECEPGTIMVVNKARASFEISYSRVSGMCQLLNMNTGDLLWTKRENVEPA